MVREVRDGKTVYVYRDPSVCCCVYIGGEPQYQAYNRLQVEKDTADEEARADVTSPWGWPTGWGPWGSCALARTGREVAGDPIRTSPAGCPKRRNRMHGPQSSGPGGRR